MKFGYLAGRWPGKLFAIAVVCVGVVALSLPAAADTFNVQFFEVTTAAANSASAPTNSDFFPGGVNTGTVSNNYVMSTLSGGMPVFNTSETGAAKANDLGAGNVLEWWTPGTYNSNTVAATGTGVLTLSSTAINMFPPNSTGTNNTGSNNCAPTLQGNCEETAILTGTFTLASAGTVPFSVSADDDAFVFVDGQLIEDLGGIHSITSGPNVSPTFSAGTHTIEIFYADQDQVAASLAFTDGGDTVSATPEPGSLALLGTGVLGIAGTLRRRMMR